MFRKTMSQPVRAQSGLAVFTAVVAVGTFALEPATAGPKAERVALDNGTTVLMRSIPEADRVAVVAFYNVGFLHEPKGMTQAAHLLEHLVCNAATKSYKQHEAMTLLGRIGMANAETLPGWTHYDYVLPSEKLTLAIQIEAERLTSLKIQKDIIAAEVPRCYRETDFVERNPSSGMIKHAFMSFNQAWRHGMKNALVRGGMESFRSENLTSFHDHFYRPDNLTLVMIGGFEPDHALELVKQHLGSIRRQKSDRLPAIDWSKIPKRMRVQWDAKVRGVCVAFPPPPKRSDQCVLSLLGSVLAQKLMADSQIDTVTDSVFCSSFQWSVGELPFFVYGAAKPGTALKKVEGLLVKRVQQIVATRPDNTIMQMRMLATQLSQQASTLNWGHIQNMADLMARHTGRDRQSGVAVALAQSAINWGVADRLLGPRPAASVSPLSSLTTEKLHRLVARHLDPNKRFVTLLVGEPSR